MVDKAVKTATLEFKSNTRELAAKELDSVLDELFSLHKRFDTVYKHLGYISYGSTDDIDILNLRKQITNMIINIKNLDVYKDGKQD